MNFLEHDNQTREDDLRPWQELPEIEEPPVIKEKVLDLETAVYIDELMELMRRRR